MSLATLLKMKISKQHEKHSRPEDSWDMIVWVTWVTNTKGPKKQWVLDCTWWRVLLQDYTFLASKRDWDRVLLQQMRLPQVLIEVCA